MKHHTHEHPEEEEMQEESDAEPSPARHHGRPVHGFLHRLIVSLLINIGALVVVLYMVRGIEFAPDIIDIRLQLRVLLIAGILMGLANGIIKPVLKFFTFPLMILTLGFTLLLINMLVFWLVVTNVEGLVVTGGLSAYFWGSLIFSIFNTIEHWALKIAHKL